METPDISAEKKNVAIVGGGISGLAVAYELFRQGIEFTLYESAARAGGIIETECRQRFVMECGPDAWLTEKPGAAELAAELGIADQIVNSNDSLRRTYIFRDQPSAPKLLPVPEGMRMMVPGDWRPVLESPLLSWSARLAYLREPKRAAELKASSPATDEPVSEFVRRHFGDEVTETLAAPLLAAIVGGDITQLSVRAVMPAFVQMEKGHGSLIQAVQMQREKSKSPQPLFSTFKGGMQSLIDRLVAVLPAESIRLEEPVVQIERLVKGWKISTPRGANHFQSLVLATPPHVTGGLLQQIGAGSRMAELLPRRSSSAILVGLGFAPEDAHRMHVPRGFGMIAAANVDRSAEPGLLACTFSNQKFPHSAPDGATLLRAFFGGKAGDALLGMPEDEIVRRTMSQLSKILGALPSPVEIVVRRLPQSLPQYEPGHVERIDELESLLFKMEGISLVGNAYRGVGIPDLIRQGRAAARAVASTVAG